MRKLVLMIAVLLAAFHIAGQPMADAGQNITICLGDSLILGGNPVASGGLAPYNFTWSPPTNINNVTDSNPSAWPTSDITYYLVIGDANGRSDTDSIVVTVLPPEQVFIVPFANACLYDKPYPLNLASPPGGYYLGMGIYDSVHFDPFSAGMGFHPIKYFYYDTLCMITDSAETTLQVHQNPQVTVSPPLDTICEGDSALVVTGGGNIYQWKPNLNLKFKSKDSVYVSSDTSGFYRIIATGAGQCKDSATFQLVVQPCDSSTGIDERAELDYSIYPNPASDRLYVKLFPNSVISFLEIRDQGGRMLLRQNRVKSQTRMEFDLSGLDSGWYLIHSPERGSSVPFGLIR